MSGLDKAKANYKDWHQKDPKSIDDGSYSFPEKAFYCGRVLYMIYESDKWEDDGDYHWYEHDFDSKPSLYARRGARTLAPNQHRFRRTPRLLCVQDINGDVPLTMLAIVMEMVVKTTAGKRQKFVFSEPPIMAGTPDNKTLVIFSDRGPLFISGGRMRITERGIVY